MILKKIKTINDKGFTEIWHIYETSFPIYERRLLEDQVDVFKKEHHNFYAAYIDENLIGFIEFWNFDNFLFVEHIAIKEEYRGKGFGTTLMKKYLKGIVVGEIDLPETEIGKKRIKFWEKLGFKKNDFKYIQPAYRNDSEPVELLLMTHPKKLNALEFISIRKTIHNKVYGLTNVLEEI